jgi:ubiquinone biosynthesis monooxygenase Coq7
LACLDGKDHAAVAAISKIVQEEQQHHDQSAAHVAAGTFWPKAITEWHLL